MKKLMLSVMAGVLLFASVAQANTTKYSKVIKKAKTDLLFGYMYYIMSYNVIFRIYSKTKDNADEKLDIMIRSAMALRRDIGERYKILKDFFEPDEDPIEDFAKLIEDVKRIDETQWSYKKDVAKLSGDLYLDWLGRLGKETQSFRESLYTEMEREYNNSGVIKLLNHLFRNNVDKE